MNESCLTRRELLAGTMALTTTASLSSAVLGGCGDDGGGLPPISWVPDIFAPVFYGWQDLDATQGAPGRLRVWYPSLEGSPKDAPILRPSWGRSPLVLFLHGQCVEDVDHYTTWFLLPAQLARSGYVVAVPDLPGIRAGGEPPWTPGSSDLTRALDVIAWIRSGWVHRDTLMPAPATAVVGHSYGALLGGRIAAASSSQARAYVSLAGVWSDWDTGVAPRPLGALQVPVLFVWGTSDPLADLSSLWTGIGQPKHRIVFRDGTHFDHWRTFPPSAVPCDKDGPGPCPIVGGLTADLAAIFLSKYLPPENSGISQDSIPDPLTPLPREPLTEEQRFYAGSHLSALTRLKSGQEPKCGATVTWQTSAGGGTAPLPGSQS